MTGDELLVALEAAGAQLTLEGLDLRVAVSARALTPAMREALQDKAPLIQAYLRREWARYEAARPPVTADPRPDVAVDHVLWEMLLAMAHGAGNEALFWALNGLRCLGARLVRMEGEMRLVCGEMRPAEYAAEREHWLLPHAGELVAMLGDLGRREERLRRMRVAA
jgi:hypothetical protein